MSEIDIRNIISDNNINISLCSDGFYIIDGWDDVNKLEDITGDKINTLFTEWGFSDEYLCCDQCYNHIASMPQYNGDKIDYWINDESVICGDCIRDNDSLINEYIEHLLNNPHNANTILTDKVLENNGFINCTCDKNICNFESGLHPGQNDNPIEILKNAQIKNPAMDYLFDITDTSMFDIHFTIYRRDKNYE